MKVENEDQYQSIYSLTEFLVYIGAIKQKTQDKLSSKAYDRYEDKYGSCSLCDNAHSKCECYLGDDDSWDT